MTCPICIDPFNLSKRARCKCAYCDYEVCRTCIQTYLITIEEDAHCMNCKKKWSREQVDGFVSKTFRNKDLKKRREELLFDKEKALLPASQAEVIRVKEVKRLTTLRKELEEHKRMLYQQLRDVNESLHMTNRQIWQLERGSGMNPEVLPKKLFTIHCPKEDCRGYVNSEDWACAMCEAKVCKDCHEIVHDDTHECKPDNIETAKLLKKETRNCPGCSTAIYKISGCNQMWCTQCHTAFNWTTGQVERGVVHNPHFYQWQQEHGHLATNLRNLGDIPCGGLPSVSNITRAIHAFKNMNELFSVLTEANHLVEKAVYNIHRVAVHIERVEMPSFRVNLETDNLDLRVKYLMNEYSEDEFKFELQKKEKKLHKKKEIYDVFEMYTFTMVDLFQNFLEEIKAYKTHEQIEAWQKQVIELQKFANTQFSKISKRYNCTCPNIGIQELKMLHY
jgi:hypothetical protein